ncbi:M10 family metallopeptidase domain-containing protein [Ilumatobacter coccineus]|uniref:hypothetical protein n=1 Tax=Ilumatobacter coccineus TaxID=467094 RepID=UPI0003487FE7|nr:hypothetical protein [Ilumatobacter coccineus]
MTSHDPSDAIAEGGARRFVALVAVAGFLASAMLVLSLAPDAPRARSATGEIVATEPTRLLDTRPGESTIDGESAGEGRIEAGETLSVRVAGRAEVPADAGAAFLNVVAISPERRGYLTIFPCDGDQPTAASLNYEGGSVTANATLARLSGDGSVCIFSSATTHLVADVTGSVPDDGSPVALTPARLFDSRDTGTTVDDLFLGGGPVDVDSVTPIDVAGRGGVPADAASVMLNVTAVGAQANGWVTVFSCDDDVPLAANLNYSAGGVVGNGALATLDDTGRVCVYSKASIELVVDVTAYVPDDRDPVAAEPIRLLESRFTRSNSTIDGQSWRLGRRFGGTTTQLQIGGRWFVPDGIDAAFINVTAIGPSTRGFVTIYPCGTERPNAASLNFVAGEVRANSVLVKLGGGGTACIYTSAETDLVVDLSGWIDDPATAPPTEPPPTSTPGATPDTVVAPSTTQPPATSPTSGAFSLLIEQPGYGVIRWDPCRPIRYLVNSALATPEQIFYMNQGIAKIEQASGIDFEYVGQTDGGHELDVPAGQNADAVLVFSSRALSSRLVGNVGVGGPSVNFYSGGRARMTSGGVAVDTEQMTQGNQHLVWAHELAHMLNLGHVSDPNELMAPLLDGQNDFGPGDRQGLWTVGAAQGCLPAVRAGDHLVASESNFGHEHHDGHDEQHTD